MIDKLKVVCVACVASVVALGGSEFWRHSDSVIELRDEDGIVRMRLGDLNSSGVFGWQILDPKGKVCASTFLDGDVVETSVGHPSHPGTLLRTRSEPEGVQLVFGDSEASSIFLGLDQGGRMLWKHRDAKGETWFDVTSDPVRVRGASLSLFGAGEEGKRPHVVVSANAKQVGINASVADQFGASLDAEVGGISRFTLGNKADGVYMQAAEVANLIELRRGKPIVTLQAGRGGAGVAVDKPNGAPGVRVGVSASGDVKHNLK